MRHWSLFVLVVALGLQALSAQPGPVSGPPAGEEASRQWRILQDIEARGLPETSAAPAARGPAERAAIAAVLADAAALRTFVERFPTSPDVGNAKRLEVHTLLRAARLGDTTQEARRRSLVAEVRKDVALSLAQRVEVAATADNLDVDRKPALTREQRLGEYQKVARGLVAEFPAFPDVYRSLVQLAKFSSDQDAKTIARDVVAMPVTREIKAQAQAIIDRHAFVGQPLLAAVHTILGENNALERGKGKRVILYSWASSDARSVEQAKLVAAKAPANSVIIGVCLDQRDLEPARAFAAQQKLPGEQLYDWLGAQGELAQRLALIEPGLVYLIGPDAVVRDVGAHRDLTNSLQANL